MRRDWVINVSIILMALPVGWVAWSGNAILLPASILFPILWSNVTNRSSAAIVAHVYFLAASRGLPQGVASYYGADLWPGLLLWLVASVGFVLVQTLLWTPHAGWWRAARYVLASVLMAVPPFGILGWAQPITSAGILFPGWGWVGLVVMLVGLAIMTTRAWPIAGTAFVGLALVGDPLDRSCRYGELAWRPSDARRQPRARREPWAPAAFGRYDKQQESARAGRHRLAGKRSWLLDTDGRAVLDAPACRGGYYGDRRDLGRGRDRL